MGIIAELKRRNVFRIGLAYTFLGWIVIQVTDTVSPALNLPDWTLSLVTWLGVIGFPFALLFAWAFELTPEGIKREHEVDRSQSITPTTGRKIDYVIIGFLIIAVAFLLVEKYSERDPPAVDVTQDSEKPSPPVLEMEQAYDSIAVLPFTNMSTDPEQDFFSDGIAEELLNALARLQNLKVAARTSSFAFKGQQSDIREIGEALNVATVLEGSLRKSGKRLRITAQLIDVKSGYHLWSETYDRELTDVFAVQDDITAQIMTALRVHLEAGETAQVTTTTNPQAYEAFMRGRQALNERTLASIQHAQEMFARATTLDPDFALAWAGQGLAIHLQSDSNYGTLAREDTVLRSDAMIKRALALQPELAEAHALLGLNFMDQWHYQEGLDALDLAIVFNSGVAEFHLWRSHALSAMGRLKESFEALDRAFELDPLHPAILGSRVDGACRMGWPPITEVLFDSLDRYPEQQIYARAACHLSDGEFAQAYRSVLALGLGFDSFLSYLRLWLKNCEEPWQFTADPAESAFVQAMTCQDDETAMSLYRGFSNSQKSDLVVQDFLAILQLRQGNYTESLATFDEVYNEGLPTVDLRSHMNSGSNLNLDRALALQKLGRNEEAMLIVSEHRRVLDQAKRDGMRSGYHILEAKMALLSGDQKAGLRALDTAFREFEISWAMRSDPVVQALVDPEKLAEMTQWLDAHIDAERAKLAWPPAKFQ